jgi:hypothetical protein
MTDPKQDSETLVQDVLPFAKQMLREHGEFFPFGGYTKPNGEIVHVGARDKLTDRPESSDLIGYLRPAFRRKAHAEEIVAGAVVCDVLVVPPGGSEKSDAIRVSVEHRGGYDAELFYPYSRSDDGELTFGAAFARRSGSWLFS